MQVDFTRRNKIQGWLVTYEQYYIDSVHDILDTVTDCLENDSSLRFNWAGILLFPVNENRDYLVSNVVGKSNRSETRSSETISEKWTVRIYWGK